MKTNLLDLLNQLADSEEESGWLLNAETIREAARQVALVPDLLAALQVCAQVLAAADELSMDAKIAIQDARAAIAKAEGQL